MCKIAIMPYIPEQHAKTAMALARSLTDPLTARDRDAFGVAAVSGNSLYTGRWLPDNAWSAPRVRRQAPPPYSNLLPVARPPAGLVTGRLPSKPQALLLHARFATSGKALTDAHPHTSPDGRTTLIHNGVVDTATLDLRRTQCDSEGILNAYTDASVSEDPANLQSALDRVSGYYALGVLTYTKGRWVCDIVRDDRAALEYVALPTLGTGTGIYITDRTILAVAARKLGIKTGAHYTVAPNSHLRIDCATGAELYSGEITPLIVKNRSWASSRYADAQRALGVWSTDDTFLPTHT